VRDKSLFSYLLEVVDSIVSNSFAVWKGLGFQVFFQYMHYPCSLASGCTLLQYCKSELERTTGASAVGNDRHKNCRR